MLIRMRRVVTALVAAVGCALLLAGPASATATTTFGSVTAGGPSVTTCSGIVCMKASGTFTYNTTYASTVVTLNVKVLRIASGYTRTSTDAVVTNQSVSFGTTKGVSLTKTFSVAQNCRTTGTYYFYTRATISNGSSSTYEDSTPVKLTGCATV